jgi:hypothetical protein
VYSSFKYLVPFIIFNNYNENILNK